MSQIGIGAGTYRVVVTDINGCDSTWAFTLNEPDPIVIESLTSDSAYCHGTATGSIELDVSGGIPGYTYSWNDGSVTEDLDEVYAGMYIVSVRDRNLCEKVDSVEVFEADRFHVQLNVASDYHGVPISCAGFSDGIILLEYEGGVGPYSFDWNTGASTGPGECTSRGVQCDRHGCA